MMETFLFILPVLQKPLGASSFKSFSKDLHKTIIFVYATFVAQLFVSNIGNMCF